MEANPKRERKWWWSGLYQDLKEFSNNKNWFYSYPLLIGFYYKIFDKIREAGAPVQSTTKSVPHHLFTQLFNECTRYVLDVNHIVSECTEIAQEKVHTREGNNEFVYLKSLEMRYQFEVNLNSSGHSSPSLHPPKRSLYPISFQTKSCSGKESLE